MLYPVPFRLTLTSLRCGTLALMLLTLAGGGPAAALAGQDDRPPLETHVLGGAADPDLLEGHKDGRYTLTGRGREAYMGRDEGSFAGFKTEASNFTITARITEGPEGTPNPKYGISVRAGLEGTDKAVNLRYDGFEHNRCIQWFMRHRVIPEDAQGGRQSFQDGLERDQTATEGFYMRIVRRYPFVRLYTSEDGEQWQSVADDYQIALLPQQVWVGLQVTAGGDGSKPVEVTYSDIDFTVDDDDATVERFEDYEEYTPPQRTWRMTQVRIPAGDDNEITPFLLMPKDMDPADIRGLIYSTGSKEIIHAGNRMMAWDSGPGQLRKPKAMDDWEGVLDIEDLRPWNEVWAHHGFVRIGGAWGPRHYEAAVEALAEATGIDHLPDMPFVVTGGSFAGGQSAQAARRYTYRTIASAPLIIGMAGADTENPDVLATPHLHVYGSRDGSHHDDALRRIPQLRQRSAQWAPAPMWDVGHVPNTADHIFFPYFFEMARLRLPESPDYTEGRVELKRLEYDDGWYGLVDTWESNDPEVIPVADYEGDSDNLVWLPNEYLARVWRSFVSHKPRTVIHFPINEGSYVFGGRRPHGWRQSFMAANEPWELVASGPLGEDVKVTWYSGLEPLEVIESHDDNPYRVTLKGLEPGLHVIHAIVDMGNEGKEISRPTTVLFTERQD